MVVPAPPNSAVANSPVADSSKANRRRLIGRVGGIVTVGAGVGLLLSEVANYRAGEDWTMSLGSLIVGTGIGIFISCDTAIRQRIKRVLAVNAVGCGFLGYLLGGSADDVLLGDGSLMSWLISGLLGGVVVAAVVEVRRWSRAA